MATNKRKDSAALFELIDKSTLKVPKNSGSLKIPSWWSSKTNPPTVPAGAAKVGVGPVKAPPPAPRTPVAGTMGATIAAGAAATGIAGGTTVVDEPKLAPTPLFGGGAAAAVADAPARDTSAQPVGGGVSIRPPATPAAISTPVSSATTSARPTGSGAPKQIFAPATMGRATAEAISAGSGGPLLGKSGKMLVIAGCGVAAIISLAVYMVLASRKETPSNSDGLPVLNSNHGNGSNAISLDDHTTQPTTEPTTRFAEHTIKALYYDNNGKVIGYILEDGKVHIPWGIDPASFKVGDKIRDTKETATPTSGPHRGTVYQGNQVNWNKDLYYIVIASYSNTKASADLARKAAEFLADYGVDVVIQTNNGTHGPVLISYQGFSSNKEAETLRQDIVKIGAAHPEAKKKGGSIWASAYAWRVAAKSGT